MVNFPNLKCPSNQSLEIKFSSISNISNRFCRISLFINVIFNKLKFDALNVDIIRTVNGKPIHHVRKMTTTQNRICFQIISVELNISSSIVDDVVVDDSEWDKCVMCPSTVIWSDDLLDEKKKPWRNETMLEK